MHNSDRSSHLEEGALSVLLLKPPTLKEVGGALLKEGEEMLGHWERKCESGQPYDQNVTASGNLSQQKNQSSSTWFENYG